jgi:hypothetical protein
MCRTNSRKHRVNQVPIGVPGKQDASQKMIRPTHAQSAVRKMELLTIVAYFTTLMDFCCSINLNQSTLFNIGRTSPKHRA